MRSPLLLGRQAPEHRPARIQVGLQLRATTEELGSCSGCTAGSMFSVYSYIQLHRDGARLMGRTSRVAACVIAGVAVSMLTGCAGLLPAQIPIPTRASLVGVWVHQGPGGTVATLELNQSGTFEVTSIPQQVFAYDGQPDWNDPLNWDELENLSGTWKLTHDRDGVDSYLDFDIAPRPGVPLELTKLDVTGSGSSMKVYYSYGDPDNNNDFKFTRVRRA